MHRLYRYRLVKNFELIHREDAEKIKILFDITSEARQCTDNKFGLRLPDTPSAPPRLCGE